MKNFKQQLRAIKRSDSDESFKSMQKDEKLHEYAEMLRERYKKDPKEAICQSVISKQQQTDFQMR